MYTQKLPILYPDDQLAVSLISGQHAICFHRSRILANAVPLGFWCGGFSSTAGLRPQQRSSTCVEPLRSLRRVHFQRVPLVFIRVAQESLATFSSRAFRLRLGRHRISSRLPLLSPSASPHRLPIPLSVSKTVTFVTQALYVRPMSQVNFWGVLFFGAERNRFSRLRIRRLRRLSRLRLRKGKASVLK